MKSKKSSASESDVVFPKLYRLRLESLECKKNRKPNGAKLNASVNRSIRISLVDKSEEVKICRVFVTVAVTGNWKDAAENDPAISFSAEYNVRFDFPEAIDATAADKLLSEKFYRDVLVMQVMPLVNMHMHSQLDMLGIDAHSRSLGMDTSGMMSGKNLVKKSSKVKESDLKKNH